MNKCKLAKSKGTLRLQIKVEKSQQLSQWEKEAVNNNEDVIGLLPVSFCKYTFQTCLEYEITGFITFREFLKIPMTKEIFARILENLVENVKSIQQTKLNPQLILYDLDRVYVNPSTQKLFFVYVPLQPFEPEGSLQELLMSIIDCAAFPEDEDTEYVAQYIQILNTGINFSLFELEEFTKNLIREVNGDDLDNMVECPKCHTMNPSDAVLCKCGFKLNGFTGTTSGTHSQVYDMFADRKGSREYTPEYDHSDSSETDPGNHGKKRADDLQEDPGKKEKTDDSQNRVREKPADVDNPPVKKKKGTTVLTLYDDPEEKRAFLIQMTTDQRIEILGEKFRIGREYGDLVLENKYISDPHMDILKQNGNWYASDLGSTNKSYVDGAVIQPREKTLLYHGCILKLANEKFQFLIE